eukprot:4156228-Amphidinium_carterae.1
MASAWPIGAGAPPGAGGRANPAAAAAPAAARQDVHHEGSRTFYDVPPSWDGKAPDKNLEPWVKAAEAWRLTTKAPPRQHAVQLLAAASGELRQVMGTMELSELTSDDGAEKLIKLVKDDFAWCLTRSLPSKLEAALYAASSKRQSSESLVGYTAKKVNLFKELERSGCPLADVAKGLILYRDAGLSRADQDTVHYWLKGDYELAQVLEALRRLERPMSSTTSARTIMYEDIESDWYQGQREWNNWETDEHSEDWRQLPGESWEEYDVNHQDEIYWQQGWQQGDEYQHQEWWPEVDEETVVEEDTLQTVLAVYPAVRDALKRDMLNRGYHHLGKGKSGSKG